MTRPPTLVLAHGASGNAASMRPHVDGLARRGIEARAIDLPVRRAEDAIPVYLAAVDGDPTGLAIGGQSYGGRVASLLAPQHPPAALVLLSYPLHAPGRSGDWESRVAHFSDITCPVLLLSGDADPMARIELLRSAVQRLAKAELVTYPRLGHTLRPVLEDALDRVAAFLKELRGS